MGTAWQQPKFVLNHLGAGLVNLSSDSLGLGLIASGTLAARSVTQGYEFVSDLLANNGSALTEVNTSGTGYGRKTLTGVTWTLSGLVCKLTCDNPDYSDADFTFKYGFTYDDTASSGTDATRPLISLIDFGGTQTAGGADFPLAVDSSGLWTFTAAA